MAEIEIWINFLIFITIYSKFSILFFSTNKKI